MSPPHGLHTAQHCLRSTTASSTTDRGARGIPTGGIRVRLHAGRYTAPVGDVASAVLRLGPEDSGGDGAPVIFEPYGDGEVSISAGLRIPASAFSPWRNGILQADLVSLGLKISSLGNISRRCTDQRPEGFEEGSTMMEVFFDDRAMPLARWPNLPAPPNVRSNGSWAWALASDQFLNSTPDCKPWINHGKNCNRSTMSYYDTGAGERPSRWAQERGGWVQGYFAKDNGDEFHPISGV